MKYTITTETLAHEGRTLCRIRRESDHLIGGWIESEMNLSHDGDCFICNEAKVYGNAIVRDNAQVLDNAEVKDYAVIEGSAIITDNAMISGTANIKDNAVIFDNAKVSGTALVQNNVKVFHSAVVTDNAIISDDVQLSGSARIQDTAKLYNQSRVTGSSVIKDNAKLYTNPEILNATIGGTCHINEKLVFKHGQHITSPSQWVAIDFPLGLDPVVHLPIGFHMTLTDNGAVVGCVDGNGYWQDPIASGFTVEKKAEVNWDSLVIKMLDPTDVEISPITNYLNDKLKMLVRYLIKHATELTITLEEHKQAAINCGISCGTMYTQSCRDALYERLLLVEEQDPYIFNSYRLALLAIKKA